MKKVFICLLAAATLGFVSCNKNYAEDYEGSYLVDVISVESVGGYEESDTTTANPMNTVLDGEEGDVLIQFLNEENVVGMTLHGNADKEGLHIKGFSMTENVEGLNIEMNYGDASTQIKNDKMSWTHTLTGQAVYQGMSFPVSGTLSFNATKQK